MLKHASRLRASGFPPSVRHVSSRSRVPAAPSSSALPILTATFLIGSSLYLIAPRPVHAESPGSNKGYETQSQLHGGKVGTITPTVFLWGRNAHNVASPTSPDTETVRRPKEVLPFKGAVLRDLALDETYGVAVNASGDVLQWGLGHSPHPEPQVTLKGRDVLKVAVAGSKVFALTKRGEVVVFPSDAEKQRLGEDKRRSAASWWKLGWFGESDYGADNEVLRTDCALRKGEKFTSISAGQSHMLAVTTHGRAFALPLDLNANVYGQLGVRRVTLLSLHSSSVESGAQMVELIPNLALNEAGWEAPPPPARLDPLLLPHGHSAPPLPPSTMTPPSSAITPTEVTKPEEAVDDRVGDIRFATVLHEIPALRGIEIAEVSAGGKHSIARTSDGRVLGWGANNYGQLGLGAALSYSAIPTPTEIPLIKSFPKASRLACTRVAAGGNSSYFVVEREDVQSGLRQVDLLASGNGQFGGIGNGTWSHQPAPVRVKTVSGLREWSEAKQVNEPIAIREITVGTTHVAAVLDNAVEQPGGVKFGRDVFVWGHNEWYQLGTGKRSNLSSPQHLPPLPYQGLKAPAITASTLGAEPLPSSGTLSPMPHSRLQLAPQIQVNGKWVEETIVAGNGGSAVYWRILKP